MRQAARVAKFADVDEYIASLPPDVRPRMEEIRQAIRNAVPHGEVGESISYGMPVITVDGETLVHVGAWKKFVSLYPAPRGDASFEAAVARYRGAKDAVSFPHAEPVPHDLLKRIIALMIKNRQAEKG